MKKTVNNNKMINIITVVCLLLTLVVLPLSGISTAYGGTSISQMAASQMDDGTVEVVFCITFSGSDPADAPSATITYTDTEGRSAEAQFVDKKINDDKCKSDTEYEYYYQTYLDITSPEGAESFDIDFTITYNSLSAVCYMTYNVTQGADSATVAQTPTQTQDITLIATLEPTTLITATPTPTTAPTTKVTATPTPAPTTVPDTTAPVAGDSGTITTGKITDAAVELLWTAATDNVTSKSKIKYIVYISDDDNIDTVANCAANGTAVNSYTSNIITYTVGSLSASSSYYVNVVAKDKAGNKTAYNMTYIETTAADSTAPQAGGSGTLSISDVTGSSAAISWTEGTDDITPQANLEYALVYSVSNNISTVSDCHNNGTVSAYSKNGLSAALTGLTEGTTYYVNVLVRDWQGNESVYTTDYFLCDDTAPVTTSEGISVAKNCTFMQISWAAATDNVTAQADIQYALYYSSSEPTSIAEAETGTLAMGYSANVTNKFITGLSPGTYYWFSIIARDEAGNKANYTYFTDYTSYDTTAPTVGNSGTLSTSFVISNGFRVNWTAATDNACAQANLEYLLYYSTSDNIDTVADCVSNGTAVGSYTANITSKFVSSLSDSTKYYVNVVVRDESGNESVYSSTSVTTVDNTAPTPGNYGSMSSGNYQYTSGTLDWKAATDNITSQENLEYAVYYSENNYTSIGEWENATLALDYTANITTAKITGLSPGTTYITCVIVRDEAGNKAKYVNGIINTKTDTTSPIAGNSGTLSASGETSSSVDVNWTAATDNITAQASLKYIVYYSTSNNIGSVANCEANGTAVGAYTANLTYKTVSGLSSGTKYYFNVVVVDEAGNQTCYTSTSATTLDTTAPAAGNSGTITVSGETSSTVDVNWSVASDNVTAQASLKYIVYYSTSDNIGSVTACESNGTAVGSYTANLNATTVSGLSAGTTYYFNVVVMDEAGNKTCYTANSTTTE